MVRMSPLLSRRLEFASATGIAASFWALAALVHVKLQGGVTELLVLGAMLLCCLLLLAFLSRRRWKSLGTPGWLLLASIASYLFISCAAALVSGVELATKDVARQGFFFLVTVAAMLGGGWMLERIGAEKLLKWMLAILATSCAVVLASPLLRDIGALPDYQHPYRMTGTFSDPNDGGFMACMTVALALAFRSNGRQRALGCLALAAGCAAGLASFSFTAAIVLGGMLTLFLLLNVRRPRQDLLHTGLTLLCLACVLVWLIVGPLVVNTHQAWVDDPYEAKRVGDPVAVRLVDNKLHKADDYPAHSWRWQRADATLGDVNAPADATWNHIEGARLPNYIPAEADRGKFLRAVAYYEKNGRTHDARTTAIGPIAPASAATTPDANAPAHAPTQSGEAKAASTGIGPLSRRMLLWKAAFNEVLESPVLGHGLYRFHYMEGVAGVPVGHQGKPAGVHNVYLMLVGEAGVVPLALYLLALLFLMRLLWTVPKSLGRDMAVGWAIVLGIYGLTFHHLLTMGAGNFVFGLSCAVAAFLGDKQRESGRAGA